jgi:glycosyltransferase involved in cell wall biosynthesis
MPDVGVIALVPDHWSDQWQPRHHVLSRLSKYYNVLWVNPAHHWRDIFTACQRSFRRFSKPADSMELLLYEPEFWLPHVYRPQRLSDALFRLRIRRALQRLTRKGCRTIILYLWRPEFVRALDFHDWDLSCYHIDDEYALYDFALKEAESRIMSSADQVIIHSPELLQKKGHLNPHTLFVPNGVDYQAFASVGREPDDLQNIPRPRIGYVGYLKKMLDWKLLDGLTACRPDWNFVFVGATHRSHHEIVEPIKRLSNRRNVFFLGEKTTKVLATYPQHFDLCIMPYRIDSYTNCIYPLKLHEYLATGRPVVATPIRSLLDFEGVIDLAMSVDDWITAIASELRSQQDSLEKNAARRNVAKQYDWNKLVREIAMTFAQRLGDGRVERLQLQH